MKKIITSLIFLLLLLVTVVITPGVKAVTTSAAPYETWTVGPGGDLVQTQTAYEPAGILNSSSKLNQPRDMQIKDDVIYVADTGNKRIVKLDMNGQLTVLIENLNEPTGVHVDSENNIYVADKGDKKIYVYNQGLNLVRTISHPVEPIFGKNSPFIPTKVTSGPRGIIYAAGEGSISGIMQFNYAGEFLGYLGTNPTNKSLYREILEFFDTTLAPITPISPENLAVDQKGSLYTTSRTETSQLKKFNIASKIVLSPETFEQPIAVYVNDFGNIYTITETGIISEYDSSGNLLFVFGGKATNTQVLGLFSNAQDIVVDSKYNIYGLDQGTGQIQILARSEFTALVHDGLISLYDGQYDVEQWENVLRMNSVFALANSVIAKTYYRTGDYQTALDYYLIAGDKTGYSETFWQVRNEYLVNNLGLFFTLVLIFIVLMFVLNKLDKRYKIYDPLRKFSNDINKVKTLRELRYGKKVLKHPINTFHEIKHEKKSSYKTAFIIYLIFVIISIVSVYTTGFIFNENNLDNYNVLTSFLALAGLVLLFVFSNYLISTLFSGEGWFKDIFIATAYALIPYIVLTIPIILISNVLTLNEIFIFNALLTFRDGWTLILIFLLLLEIHNYSVGELIKNILLTIFTMAIIVAISLLMYLLVTQMYDYISSIIKEVISRVIN